jgi:hypothetical protein
MPQATRADVDRVSAAITGLGSTLTALEDQFNSLRNGPGLTPVGNTTVPSSTPAAAGGTAGGSWLPILLLAGGGLLIFFLLKGR